MRRTIPVIAATAGGLALLANFHTGPGALTSATRRATSPAGVAAAPEPPSDLTSPSTVGRATTSTTTLPATRSIDGPVIPTRYGDVQVRVTLNGRQIVDVQALMLPNDRNRSVRISNAAGPLLRREALQAQSAQIDLVSGASYTSDGYAQSLQGALDQANP